MNESHDATAAPRPEEEPLDPQAADLLLRQTTAAASRQLQYNMFPQCLLGGFLFLIAYGDMWLSVRHQHPYRGPSGGSIGVLYLLILVVDVIAVVNYRRSAKGVRGRVSRQRRVIMAVGVVGIVGVYVIMGALYHAGVTRSVVYGIYPASVPLLVGGMIGAVAAANREDWTLFWGSLAVSGVGAGAAWAGAVNSWAVSGFGSCAVLLTCASVKLLERRT